MRQIQSLFPTLPLASGKKSDHPCQASHRKADIAGGGKGFHAAADGRARSHYVVNQEDMPPRHALRAAQHEDIPDIFMPFGSRLAGLRDIVPNADKGVAANLQPQHRSHSTGNLQSLVKAPVPFPPGMKRDRHQAIRRAIAFHSLCQHAAKVSPQAAIGIIFDAIYQLPVIAVAVIIK